MYKITLSDDTVKILENFNSINQSILFREGNKLSTISPVSKAVYARAEIKEKFESEFAIFDLSVFLGALSAFEKPELSINDKYLVVSEGKRHLNYTFADQSTIVFPPARDVKMPAAVTSFKLAKSDINFISKMWSILKLPEVSIEAKDGKLTVNALDSKNPTGDVQRIDVADCEATFKLIFKTQNINLMDGDYDVDVTKGLVRFKGPAIEYYVRYEATSEI
jgi:hypothetical protein